MKRSCKQSLELSCVSDREQQIRSQSYWLQNISEKRTLYCVRLISKRYEGWFFQKIGCARSWGMGDDVEVNQSNHNEIKRDLM